MNYAGMRMVTRSQSRGPGAGPLGSGEKAAPIQRGGEASAGSAATGMGKGRRGGRGGKGLGAGVRGAHEGSEPPGLGPGHQTRETRQQRGSSSSSSAVAFPPSALFPRERDRVHRGWSRELTPPHSLFLNKDVFPAPLACPGMFHFMLSYLWGRPALFA